MSEDRFNEVVNEGLQTETGEWIYDEGTLPGKEAGWMHFESMTEDQAEPEYCAVCGQYPEPPYVYYETTGDYPLILCRTCDDQEA